MIARSSSALDWLESNGGTPSLAAAPNHFKKGDQPSCRVNWSDYHSRTIPPAPRFLIIGYKLIHITGADGLNNLRTAIARGSPIAFGTSLYADFKHYRGGPSPYVGNGQLLHESSGKKADHAMLIVAYDVNHHGSGGAVRIQNSCGTSWGERGFVWMAYDALEKLAQSKGIYLKWRKGLTVNRSTAPMLRRPVTSSSAAHKLFLTASADPLTPPAPARWLRWVSRAAPTSPIACRGPLAALPT
jgi:hypothetical protein